MVSPTFLFMILLTMEFAICCCGGDSSFDCTPREKKALLKFKASLLDPSKRLSSWDDHKDCCAWDGVKCDKTTGHVSGLDLRNNNPYTPNMLLQGNKLDSSLLELKYLSYLDLSYNDFKLSPIPAFLGSMKHLQYLNLSTASFGGVVPRDLGNLPNLHTLDLTGPGLVRGGPVQRPAATWAPMGGLPRLGGLGTYRVLEGWGAWPAGLVRGGPSAATCSDPQRPGPHGWAPQAWRAW
ncbi:hypothetical protein BUALT_Bualt16G0089300 [Buddleja alternifolia]|uniref:Leucine-rich repeat-containing N-terminal plant-type domain-containing protein n=1 Tax=Buddleja alternifolia TaxID=168488 RepID=A0AAV6W827_9LAMI|nr:hypothetical protein BUALT_Bualt16G0089300 [Buddleja alternifolia]